MPRAFSATSALLLLLSSAAGAAGGADQAVFRARRTRVLRELGPGALAVLYGAEKRPPGRRQLPDFYYLTGIREPGAVLVLAPGQQGGELLFLRPRDPERERWQGPRLPLGPALRRRTGFRAVHRTTQLGEVLAQLSGRAEHLVSLPPIAPFDRPLPRELRLYRKLMERAPALILRDRHDLLRRMRMIKDAAELALIGRAAEISVAAHLEAWRALRPGMSERAVRRLLEAAFLRGGADGPAYTPIVGGGRRATILHGKPGQHRLLAGELVLIDAGARVGEYNADVTRTLPVSGRFTPEQRRLYEIVLAAQRAALAQVKPGARLKEDVHRAAQRVLAGAGLGAAFLHGTSHYVGLEVHDVADDTLPLRPGMVVTVEPGIYLPAKKIGIRIEDTVVVTKGGHRNLSASLPKEVEAIEKWMAARQGGKR